MTDSRLRELERRWKETGEPEDGARWVQARLRHGLLDRETAALAVYLGHPAPPLGLTHEVPAFEQSFEEWVAGLARWGDEAVLRAGIALTRRALSIADLPSLDLMHTAAGLVEAALFRSVPIHLLERVGDDLLDAPSTPVVRLTLTAVRAAERFLSESGAVSLAGSSAEGALGVERARAAMREELTPWCLGLSDPVRERVVTERSGALGIEQRRRYPYVGPANVLERSRGQPPGQVVTGPADVSSWATETQQECDAEGLLKATFVVDQDGQLRIEDYGSEHVACSGGEPVLSAGVIWFELEQGAVRVERISNQSTGFCPEPESWLAVEEVLEALNLPHPGRFTQEIVFRRCAACGQRNIVKDEWFVCAVCDAELPQTWNVAP